MKRYNSFERNKPFSLGERLSRLLTFDFRAQFAIEGGLDACLSLVVFGHGLTLGFTRGVPHVIAGVYLGVSALTEQFDMTFGFQSDWYDEYLNRLVDEIRPCTALPTYPRCTRRASTRPCRMQTQPLLLSPCLHHALSPVTWKLAATLRVQDAADGDRRCRPHHRVREGR